MTLPKPFVPPEVAELIRISYAYLTSPLKLKPYPDYLWDRGYVFVQSPPSSGGQKRVQAYTPSGDLVWITLEVREQK